MISVAMAVYNGSRYIKQQLESIRDQTLAPDEVIICDDRSGDDTADIVRQFITSSHLEDTWKLYINETNLGFVNNFKKAVCKTTGDLVFLADQDDYFFPEKFEIMEAFFRRRKDCMLLASGYRVMDSRSVGRWSAGDCVCKKKAVKLDFCGTMYHSHYPGFSMGFRDRVRERLRTVRLEGFYGHDIALLMIGLQYHGFYYMNSVLGYYRLHEHNTSGAGRLAHNKSLTARICQKQEEMRQYQALEAFCHENKLWIYDDRFMYKRRRQLARRIWNMRHRRIADSILMLFFDRAYPVKTLLGDLYMMIRVD